MQIKNPGKLKQYVIYFSLIVLFLLTLCLLKDSRSILSGKPLADSLALISPAFSVSDADGNIYIVDNSFQRIIKTDKQQNLLKIFAGGTFNKKGFYNCSDLAVDSQGSLYLSSVEVNVTGMALNKESILQYNSDGSFNREIFCKTYAKKQAPLLNGWISCVQEIKDKIYFVYKEENSLALYEINSGKTELLKRFAFKKARKNIINSTIVSDLKSLMVTTKDGKIVNLSENKQQAVYQGYGEIGASRVSIPWDVACYQGQVFFTDLGDRQIKKIMADGRLVIIAEYSGKKESKALEESPIYKRLTVDSQGRLITTDTFSVVSLKTDGSDYCKINQVFYTELDVIKRIAFYLFLLFWLLFLLWLGCVYLTRINFFAFSPILKTGILIFTVSFIIASVIGFILMRQFNQTMEKQVVSNVMTVTNLSSQLINGDILDSLNCLADYNSENYRLLNDKMNDFINQASDDGDNLYYVIYKTDGKNVYQCMDYIGSGGLLNIMDTAYAGSYYEKVIGQGQQIKIDTFQDSTGVWTYAVGPIYNSQGRITAAIEIGRNLSVLAISQKKFIVNTIISIVVITIIIFLVFTEFLYLMTALRKKYKNKSLGLNRGSDLEYVRPLTFTLFIADYLQTAFLPIYVSSLYTPVSSIPKSLAIAFPLSAEVCTSAVSAVAAGYLKDKLSLRKIFLFGSWLVIIGFVFCGLSHTITFFALSKLIVGWGMGFLYVATSTMIAEQDDEEVISKGYSDYYAAYFSAINVGCVAGGGLATLAGYRTVFWVAALVSFLALMLTKVLLGDNTGVVKQNKEVPEEKKNLGLSHFIFNPQVFALLFAIYIPYLIGSYFLYYFFPLFAFAEGMSESSISHIFLLNGLFVVYLGPFLTPRIKKICGVFGGTILGSVFCLAAFAIFIFDQELVNAVITAALLGIADSFAYTMQTTYYTSLKPVHAFGLSKANGIKNTAEHLGYTLAPFTFGSVLLCGNAAGIAIIAGGMAAGLVFFILMGCKDNLQKKKSG